MKKLGAMIRATLSDPYVLGMIGLFALTKSMDALLAQARELSEAVAAAQAQAGQVLNGQVPADVQVEPVPAVEVPEA